MREHPELTVWVSEIGAPHLIDPSRLERSARRLYGDTFDKLWGELAPVPEENVRIASGRAAGLEVFPSPGHASHHVCYLDGTTLYAGDAAGVRIQPSRSVLPPTPPPDVDVEAWYRDVRRDRAPRPRAARADPLRARERRQPPPRRAARAARHLGGTRSRMEPPRRSSSPAGKADLPPEEAEAYDRAMPFWQSYQGLRRYWDTRAA